MPLALLASSICGKGCPLPTSAPQQWGGEGGPAPTLVPAAPCTAQHGPMHPLSWSGRITSSSRPCWAQPCIPCPAACGCCLRNRSEHCKHFWQKFAISPDRLLPSQTCPELFVFIMNSVGVKLELQHPECGTAGSESCTSPAWGLTSPWG
uniref:Uncharacterized protein n=1 Tax=Athene cunicularia TaxID=194338 RepID=A0A663MSB2_ATHCN